jgi:hypothetical protein
MTELVKAPTVTILSPTTKLVVWTLLDGDDSGQAVFLPQYSDKCVQILGTFDSSSITMYGSNDVDRVRTDLAAGTLFGSATAAWTALTDPQGNAITKTAEAIEQILENPAYICPVNSSGGGSAAIEIMMTVKQTR